MKSNDEGLNRRKKLILKNKNQIRYKKQMKR